MPEDKEPKPIKKSASDDSEAIDSSGIGEVADPDAAVDQEGDDVEGHMFGGVLRPPQIARGLRANTAIANTVTANFDAAYTLYGGLGDQYGEISQRPEH